MQLPMDPEDYLRKMNELVLPFFSNFAATGRDTFLGRGGATLSCICAEPPEGVVHSGSVFVLVPGRTESYFKYAETIYDLCLRGHRVFAYDHRGQGFSERLLANPQVGYVHDFNDYVEDLETFLVRFVKLKLAGQIPAPRVFLLAHSMGAAVSLKLLLLQRNKISKFPKISGVLLSAPMLAIKLTLPAWLTEAVVALRCLMGKDKEFVAEPGGFDSRSYGEDLTHSTARLVWYRQALRANPELQLGLPSNHWMREALRWTDELRTELRQTTLALPLVLLAPGRDSVVDTTSQGLVNGSESGRMTLRVPLPESFHDPFIETDDIRAKVFESIDSLIGAALESEE